ncbi:MAG: CoA ester lyase [Brevundimonas sp.]|jgi:citrate lyase subunit beta/citryl-CoA lyase|uniref:HpcH/HpaI aldolase/citrate lyase family protein n=1 Tax=Brevundimonas sp. TaxID=1871086 RepID=UPI0025C1EF41|nr:CoA ester lyase [Brevundimonas sp.]MCH4269505.1 CoA ester lyase [Brevundimonas sp.]
MLLDLRPRRSALYLPASNDKAIVKSRALPADVVILDLEDAVAPDAKVAARGAAVAAAAQAAPSSETLIRCNGLDTAWGEEDVRAIASSGARGMVAPKVSSADDVDLYDARLAEAPGDFALWVMIETCRSVFALDRIAARAQSTRLAGFIIGTNDLAREMRAKVPGDRTSVLPVLTQAVIAARAYGLVVLDGVCNEFNAMDVFEAECRQAVMLGFDGKTLIHPRQIEPCNAVFAPTEAEIIWAGRLIEAFGAPENIDKGAISLDGRMVERLHLEEAHRIQANVRMISGSH